MSQQAACMGLRSGDVATYLPYSSSMQQKSVVIGIGGQVGAGKSSLAAAMAAYIEDLCIFDIDQYEWAGLGRFPLYEESEPETAIAAWIARGGDPREYRFIPRLRDDLTKLRSGGSVTIPGQNGDERTFGPAEVILFESHFGRDEPGAEDLIDIQVHIDLPLDVSLARKLMQVHHWPRFDLPTYINSYVAADRLVLERMKQTGSKADIVVNGIEPVSQIAKQVVTKLSRRMPELRTKPVH